MTYREQLEKAKEIGLNVIDLMIANECEDNFNFSYTEEEFEKLCEFVRVCFIKSDCTTESITNAINFYVCDKNMTIKQVLSFSYHKIIDEACWH